MLLIAAAVVGAMIGPAGGVSRANWDIVWNIRLPRVVLAGIVSRLRPTVSQRGREPVTSAAERLRGAQPVASPE